MEIHLGGMRTNAQTVVLSHLIPQTHSTVSKPTVFVSKETELMLHPPRIPCILDHIRRVLAKMGIEILASSPYSEGRSQQLLLVVHDGQQASAALHAAGIECRTEAVLLIDTPLQSNLIAVLGTTLMRHGVGIQYTYTSASNGSRIAAVFKTTDEARAFEVLTGNARQATPTTHEGDLTNDQG